MNRIIAACVLAMLAAFAHAWDPEVGTVPKPINTYEYLDGKAIDLNALKGAPVILYFGGDWCPPCVARGRPAVLDALKKYGDQGVKAVFFSADDNSLREEKRRAAEVSGFLVAMPKLDRCPPGKCHRGLKDLGEFGQIYFYPMVVMLDGSGKVVDKITHGQGVQSNLNRMVEKALASK